MEDQPTAEPGAISNIVTRIVERTVIITVTPGPESQKPTDLDLVTLDLSLSDELPNLDPQLASRAGALNLTENLFVGLTNYNVQTNQIEPELALAWNVADDGRTWTFTLRDDIFWVRPDNRLAADEGLVDVEAIRPVEAQDVVQAIRRVCSREVENPVGHTLFLIEGCEQVNRSPQSTLADLEGIAARALDPTTLEVTLTKPADYFLPLTSTSLFKAVPYDLVEELGNEWRLINGDMGNGWQTPDNLVVSGPYVPVLSTLTSKNLTLHRNGLWPIPMQGNVDEINLLFVDDTLDAFALWSDRTLDVAPLPLSERGILRDRSPEKTILVPEQVLFYIGFDFGAEPFREIEVRRAFSAAIDRDRLVEELYGDRGLAMRHAVLPGVIGGFPADQVGVGYSPDYARQQMDQSSYGSCRLMPPVSFLVSSADLSLRQAELIRDMWVDELDCPEEVINLEQAQFGALLAATGQNSADRPDLWELAWAPAYPDAHNAVSDLLHCDDSDNRQNRECSEADTLLRRAASTLEAAERESLYRQVETLLFGESGIFPIIPLYLRAEEFAIQEWVDFVPTLYGGQQYDTFLIDMALKNLERSR